MTKLTVSTATIRTYEKRSMDRQGYFLDISKISRDTGWGARFSVEEGLKRTYLKTRIADD